jgi:DNA invertase Pin-like site-specific DNA recombinase
VVDSRASDGCIRRRRARRGASDQACARRHRRRDHRRIAYLRVSTDEQAESGAGLTAQRTAIRHEVERRGWTLVATHTDAGLSGKTMERTGLLSALVDVRSARVGTLMVAKLDRLSRSLVDFAGVMADATERRWNLVELDLGIDLSTPAGEFMASVMAASAAWERRIIGQRTKTRLPPSVPQACAWAAPRPSAMTQHAA